MEYNNMTVSVRVATDPRPSMTSRGTKMLTFLAIGNRSRSGERPRTDVFNVLLMGASAMNAERLLSKGREVLLNGTMQIERRNRKDLVPLDEINNLLATAKSATALKTNLERLVAAYAEGEADGFDYADPLMIANTFQIVDSRPLILQADGSTLSPQDEGYQELYKAYRSGGQEAEVDAKAPAKASAKARPKAVQADEDELPDPF